MQVFQLIQLVFLILKLLFPLGLRIYAGDVHRIGLKAGNIFFANTALVGAAMIRLQGGDPTLADGVRIASKNFLNILGYALIAATVGMILDRIREAKGNSFWNIISRWLVSIMGVAWNIATFLVVPVLAVEGVGPIEAIKRSGSLLKKTWGEQIAGNFGLGAIFGLAVLLPLPALLFSQLVPGWAPPVALLAPLVLPAPKALLVPKALPDLKVLLAPKAPLAPPVKVVAR